jgi:hypothetical protein
MRYASDILGSLARLPQRLNDGLSMERCTFVSLGDVEGRCECTVATML